MEVYYEWIQKLAHGLQVATIDSFLTTMFRMGLQSYLRNCDYKDEVVKEVTMLCEKNMITIEARSAFSVP